MQAFSNQQSPDLQALITQFLAQLPPAQLEQLTSKSDGFPDIRTESRTHVPTDVAGRWLGRKNQTLRIWALTGHPIAPLRINGRLAWPTAEIRRLLGVHQTTTIISNTHTCSQIRLVKTSLAPLAEGQKQTDLTEATESAVTNKQSPTANLSNLAGPLQPSALNLAAKPNDRKANPAAQRIGA